MRPFHSQKHMLSGLWRCWYVEIGTRFHLVVPSTCACVPCVLVIFELYFLLSTSYDIFFAVLNKSLAISFQLYNISFYSLSWTPLVHHGWSLFFLLVFPLGREPNNHIFLIPIILCFDECWTSSATHAAVALYFQTSVTCSPDCDALKTNSFYSYHYQLRDDCDPYLFNCLRRAGVCVWGGTLLWGFPGIKNRWVACSAAIFGTRFPISPQFSTECFLYFQYFMIPLVAPTFLYLRDGSWCHSDNFEMMKNDHNMTVMYILWKPKREKKHLSFRD